MATTPNPPSTVSDSRLVQRTKSSESTSVRLINPRQIFLGLVLGILFTLISTSTSLHPLLTRIGLKSFGTGQHQSEDHQSWKTWHTVQLNTPFVPNHDPNDLGQPPPKDLISKRPSPTKSEKLSPLPKKMILPKKLNLHRSDEL